MICTSIHHKTSAEIKKILGSLEMAEIRLDSCPLSDDETEEIFLSDVPLIATCRAIDGDFATVERKLVRAVKAGAAYADLEIEAPGPVGKRVSQACREWGTVLIRSWHDFNGTPSLDELKATVDRCRHFGGEIVKIATTANNPDDEATVGSLYSFYTADSLVAFAMGEAGRQSRIDCLAKGAPFSYAFLDGESPSAAGQYSCREMHHIVYGDRQLLDGGVVRVPSSKSYAQRAILAAALAEGTSILKSYTPCADSETAIALVKSFGATVVKKRGAAGTQTLEITGTGSAHPGTLPGAPDCPENGVRLLDVGESGLLARLMIPLSSRLFPQGCTINGHGTMLSRPLVGVREAMAGMGVSVEGCTGAGTPSADRNLVCNESDGLIVPLKISGNLTPGRTVIDGSTTSQLASGVLMALPLCARNSTLSIMHPVSIPYMFMTMDILHRFGVKLRSEMYGGRKLLGEDWSKCTEILVKIKENQCYKATDLTIEGDWSAAAALLVAGAVFGQMTLEGLDSSSIQPDLCILDILMQAGACVSQIDEPLGAITVHKAPLRALRVDLTNSPDLFPVVAVLCAFCQGKSMLTGVRRLRHKESDRAEAILQMLQGFGVQAFIKDDTLCISGESLAFRILGGRLLRGGSFSSHGDHRMVMALRVASLGASSDVEIDDTACVAKSYPSFNDVFYEHLSLQNTVTR